MKEKRNLKFFRIIIPIIYCSLILVPIVWMISSSLKPNNEIFANPWSPPNKWYFDNYKVVVKLGLGRFLMNSVVITVVSVVIIVFLGSLAAYVFARQDFRFKKILFYLTIGGMMVPVHIALIPIYVLTAKVNLFNNYFSVIGPYVGFGLPFTIFILWGYFLTIPRELEEAAMIDGCSKFRIYWNIILPISKPALSTVVIFQSYIIWNEFLFALVFLKDESVRTLPVGIFTKFTGYFLTNWGGILAGLFISAVPIVVLYLLFQNNFIKGITAGALKE